MLAANASAHPPEPKDAARNASADTGDELSVKFAVPAPRPKKEQIPAASTTSPSLLSPRTPRSTAYVQMKRAGSPVTPHPSLVRGQVNQLRGHKQGDGTTITPPLTSEKSPVVRKKKFLKMATGPPAGIIERQEPTVQFNTENSNTGSAKRGVRHASAPTLGSPSSVHSQSANAQPARNFQDMLQSAQSTKAKRMSFANLKPMSSPKLAPHSSEHVKISDTKGKTMFATTDDLRSRLTDEIEARVFLEKRVQQLERALQALIKHVGFNDNLDNSATVESPVVSFLAEPLDIVMSCITLVDNKATT